jgi:hypothetical protein
MYDLPYSAYETLPFSLDASPFQDLLILSVGSDPRLLEVAAFDTDHRGKNVRITTADGVEVIRATDASGYSSGVCSRQISEVLGARKCDGL